MNTKNRLGFVGIIIDDRDQSAGRVNEILSEHAELILARTGIPKVKGNTSVKGNNDFIEEIRSKNIINNGQ